MATMTAPTQTYRRPSFPIGRGPLQSSLNLVSAAMFFSLLSHAQVNILTANGNNDRTNSNLQETQLSDRKRPLAVITELSIRSDVLLAVKPRTGQYTHRQWQQ